MKRTTWICAFSACLGLAGCMTPANDPDAALTAAFADTTFTNASGTVIIVNADGTMNGPEGNDLAGTWEIENGKWCRTLTAPAQIAGHACQDIVLNGNVATINGTDWTMS